MENNFQFTSAAISDRGLSEKRPQNEDSYLELGSNGVFAVADGVGGAQAGDVASQMAMEILGEAFVNLPIDIDAEEIMKVAIERANGAIFQMSNELPQLSSMATTIVALHLSGNIATIGHVGDSRVYRIDPDGRLHRETRDHSVVEEEVRAGRMTPEQAVNHPSRNVISRALGAEDTVDVEMKTIMVEPGTMFLLCSDGITRHISDSEIADLFHAELDPVNLCEQMKEICYSRGAEDNLTAVVVRISTQLAGGFTRAAAASSSFSPLDFEDETVATARPPFDRPAEPEEASHFATEPENRPQVPVETAEPDDRGESDDETQFDQEPHLIEDPPETPTEHRAESAGYTSSSVVVPAQTPANEQLAKQYIEEYKTERTNRSFITKALSAIALLLLGGILGVAAYSLLMPPVEQPVQPAPVITEQKSNNVSLTAFEDGRRLVDRDPAQYIRAEAASAQVPEDYFLLGRAFLLTGNAWEAKRQFGLAKDRLAQADPMNAKTLASEIDMALVIIDDPQAWDAFRQTLPATSNANTSVNTNTPVR